MFIFTGFCLIFGAVNKIQKFRRATLFAKFRNTVPGYEISQTLIFRNSCENSQPSYSSVRRGAQACTVAAFGFWCTVHCFVFYDIYIYIYIYIYNCFYLIFLLLKKKIRCAKFRNPSNIAAQFCFEHNFFIRTLFWVILIPLVRLESVESKYSQKEHF